MGSDFGYCTRNLLFFLLDNSTKVLQDYTKSDAVTIGIIVDNYDIYSKDPDIQRKLKMAKEWEAVLIDFLLEWEKNPNNTKYGQYC